MDKLYNDVAFKISRLVTREYSTSFSVAVSFLEPESRQAINSIYGFVRYADEIVDTFHSVDKRKVLELFENEYYAASERGVSTNPILHAFQLMVKKYHINDELIQGFLKSMKYDLNKSTCTSREEMNEYIYGSADVVGLMCLRVFVDGDETLYNQLKTPAMKLGSAFQKINFLRDIKNDTEVLKRRYFPEFSDTILSDGMKEKIITDIKNDFAESYKGIQLLPGRSRLAVTIAYYYYKTLLAKIQHKPAEQIMTMRVRISDFRKFLLFLKAYLAYFLNLI